MKNNWLTSFFQKLDMSSTTGELLAYSLTIFAVILAAILVTLVIRKTLLTYLTNWIQSNRYRWDDPLAGNNFLTRISWFVPVTIFFSAIDIFLDPEPQPSSGKTNGNCGLCHCLRPQYHRSTLFSQRYPPNYQKG